MNMNNTTTNISTSEDLRGVRTPQPTRGAAGVEATTPKVAATALTTQLTTCDSNVCSNDVTI